MSLISFKPGENDENTQLDIQKMLRDFFFAIRREAGILNKETAEITKKIKELKEKMK